MALLFLFSKVQKKLSLRLTAAHLNHALQKSDAAKAETAVKRYARSLGIPVIAKTADVRGAARRTHCSIEEAGRNERYRFFESAARRLRSGAVATAHTLDDQVETALFRLIRGSGLKGLAGIPPKRTQGAVTLIRPLLWARKNEILELLREERVPFVMDRTNADTVFSRNRIRHELIPMLEKKFNAQVKSAILNLQHIAHEAHDYIESEAARSLKRTAFVRRAGGGIRFSAAQLRRLHPALLGEVLRKAYSQHRGDLKRLTHEHIAAVTELVHSGVQKARLNLPHGIVVSKSGPDIHIR